MLWVTLVLVIACLIVCLMLIPIEIRIMFHHVHSDDGGVLEVRYLFGLIKLKRELSQISAHPSDKGATISTSTAKSSSVTGGQARTAHVEVTDLLTQLDDIFSRVLQSKPILKRLAKHLHILKFHFDAALGVEDATFTGVAVGTAHMVMQTLVGWMSWRCRFHSRPKIQVEPVYQGMAFDVQFESIIHVRLGYAISAARKLLIVWKRRT